eukprot:c5928_g1_i1.p1 GENE.c5928_g1_i1~~c5928_g1_i1.p1  ORF type:complete len:130 (+),score=14.00 c5928_g1_i1:38-427(+)
MLKLCCVLALFVSVTLAADVICEHMTSCSSCTTFSECAWCKHERHCVPASSVGQDSSSVCGDYDYRHCTNEPCGFYSNCASCTQAFMCGWCPERLKCIALNTRSKALEEGACSNVWAGTCSGPMLTDNE